MAALISPADLPEAIRGRSDCNRLIQTVSDLAEDFCRRSFVREVGRVETHDGGDCHELWLRLTPVESIASVTVDGRAVTDFVFNPTNGRLTRGTGQTHPYFANWNPAGADNISVTYTGGYSRIPEAVKEAVVQGVVNYVREKDRDPAMQSESFGRDYSYTMAANIPAKYRVFGDTGIAILRRYRRSGKNVVG